MAAPCPERFGYTLGEGIDGAVVGLVPRHEVLRDLASLVVIISCKGKQQLRSVFGAQACFERNSDALSRESSLLDVLDVLHVELIRRDLLSHGRCGLSFSARLEARPRSSRRVQLHALFQSAAASIDR